LITGGQGFCSAVQTVRAEAPQDFAQHLSRWLAKLMTEDRCGLFISPSRDKVTGWSYSWDTNPSLW